MSSFDTSKTMHGAISDPAEPNTSAPAGPGIRQTALIRAAQSAGKTEADISWPSKGVDFYAYLDSSAFTTAFTKPTDWGRHTSSSPLNTPQVTQMGNLQIAENDIKLDEHTGRYTWNLSQNGNSIMSEYAEIAPSTGNLGSTTMGDMLETPSQIQSGWAVSYGFYDSGHGVGGLTNQDQSYVYATRDMSNWMGDLASQMGTTLTDKPFSVFALPGAHDSGMFDPTCVSTLLKEAEFLAALAVALGVDVAWLAELAEPSVLRAIINLAFTQKDNINTMLNLGVRYFDFRPGYCYDGVTSGIYHQHNFIPGYPFQSFLQDVVAWLAAHPTEIVVISPNYQGFNKDEMKPEASVIIGMISDALPSDGSILGADKADLTSTYAELIAAKQRLIVFPQIGLPSGWEPTKYDSYNSTYETSNVQNILTAIGNMNEGGQAGNTYTVLQLQGTASGIAGGIFDSIVTLSDASSPLMSTKPGFDFYTYPWLMQNVTKNLSAKQLVVFLNDFCDNALAATASAITQARAQSL